MKVFLSLVLTFAAYASTAGRLSDSEFNDFYRELLDEEQKLLEWDRLSETSDVKSRRGPHRRWTSASRAVGMKARVLHKLRELNQGTRKTRTCVVMNAS